MPSPRIVYTELDGSCFLVTWGETGSCGGLATCSRPQKGRKNRAIAEGKLFHAPRGGSRALDFSKYDTLLKVAKLFSYVVVIASSCATAGEVNLGGG